MRAGNGPNVPRALPRTKSHRRHLRPRARFALACGLAFFALAQVGLIVFMEVRRPELRHPEYGYRLRRLQQRLAEEPDRPLVLVLGSSRTEVGFRPEVLADYRTPEGASPFVFNFGLSSTGCLEELVHLRRLLREGVRPTWVLVEVLPSDLCNAMPALENYDKLDRSGWRDLAVLRPYFDHSWRAYERWAERWWVPWSSHRFLVLNHYAPMLLPAERRRTHLRDNLDRSGWIVWRTSVTPEEHRRGFEFARDFYAPAYRNYRIGELSDRALRQLLGLCRQHGVRAGLFLMPEDEAFRSWYTPAGWEALHDYLTRLGADYGVPVLDARDWVSGREGFMDGHHLLPPAAAEFSRRFGREMIQPLVEGRPVATRLLWPGDHVRTTVRLEGEGRGVDASP